MQVSEVNFTTTLVRILREGDIVGSATGFFFKHNAIPYLATNRHVVVDVSGDQDPDQLQLVLHRSKQNLQMNWPLNVDLYSEGKQLWLQHPTHDPAHCDVALIPLDEKSLPGSRFDIFLQSKIVFIESVLVNKEDVNPFGDVVIIGYPLGFYDEKNNLPVYRKAMMASQYGVAFQDLPCFLIDANLHPGTSGSPVLNSHHTLFKSGGSKEGYKLFGVHSAEAIVNEKPLGLNIVWYASLLIEIARGSA